MALVVGVSLWNERLGAMFEYLGCKALDDILLGFEEEADEVSLGKHGVGCRHGVVELLSNEQLDVLEPEGVLCGVGTASAVSPGRRRKKKATQVRLLMEIFLCVVPWEAVSTAWIMLTRRGRTIVGGESSF